MKAADETKWRDELEKTKKLPWYQQGKPPKSWIFQQRDWLEDLEKEWGRWGAEGIGRLRKVILGRPHEGECRPEFLKDPVFYRLYKNELPNLQKWQEQYEEYVKALKDFGVEVHFVEPPSPCIGPYGFLKWCTGGISMVLVTRGGAIVPRFAISGWQTGSAPIWVKKLVEIGCPILHMVYGTGAVSEIGCNVWLDSKHIMVAEGLTSNMKGISQLLPIFEELGIEVFVSHTPGPLELWGFPTGGVSHIDYLLNMADANVAVIYPTYLNYETISYLKKFKITLIEVPPEEFWHMPCNFMLLEPGKIIMPSAGGTRYAAGEGPVKTIKALEKEGVDVIVQDWSESSTVAGGPHCATMKLLRDQGPCVEELR